jgi:multidrug resistance protein
MNKIEKLLLATLAVVQFTHIMDFMIMMPMSEILMKLFKISPDEFGMLVSAYNITAFVSCLLSISFIDRFERKKLLIAMYSGFIIGTFLCGLAPSYATLFLARVVAGFFGGVLSALILSIIGDAFSADRRGRAMGIVMLGFSAAAILGVPIGFYLANQFNWHIPFVIVGTIALLNLFLIARLIPDMPLKKENVQGSTFSKIKQILSNKPQMFALLLTLCIVFSQFLTIPFITPYIVRNVGIPKEYVSLVYLVGGAFTVFSSPLIGKLSDKHGKFRVLLVLSCVAILPILALTNLPVVSLWVVLTVTSLFFIFVAGRMIPAMALVTATTSSEGRGVFMSINSATQQLSSGLASFVAGSIIVELPDKMLLNYDYVGYLSVFTAIIAVGIAFMVQRKISEKP